MSSCMSGGNNGLFEKLCHALIVNRLRVQDIHKIISMSYPAPRSARVCAHGELRGDRKNEFNLKLAEDLAFVRANWLGYLISAVMICAVRRGKFYTNVYVEPDSERPAPPLPPSSRRFLTDSQVRAVLTTDLPPGLLLTSSVFFRSW